MDFIDGSKGITHIKGLNEAAAFNGLLLSRFFHSPHSQNFLLSISVVYFFFMCFIFL